MTRTPKTPSATPASSRQDDLYRIVEQFYLHTGKAYSEAEHLDYMDEAIAALRTYISQHYVPVGQASDDELDRILICNCGGNEYLNGSHYDDCAKNLKPALLAWQAQHTKEAVEAAEAKARLDELNTALEIVQEKNDVAILNWFDRRLAELTSAAQSKDGDEL